MQLEELTKGSSIKGILPNQIITVIDVKWCGSNAVELTYKDANGHLGNELIYREAATSLEIVTQNLPWNFIADGYLLRLVSEAQRIKLAHLFDSLLAVHTSIVEPLPH
jgi:hypothetical protein